MAKKKSQQRPAATTRASKVSANEAQSQQTWTIFTPHPMKVTLKVVTRHPDNCGTLFEILVYACDQQAFVAAVTAKAERQLFSPTSWPPLGYATEQELDDMRKQMLDRTVAAQMKCIPYNELVGCIQVVTVGTKLRAKYSFTDKTRIIIGSEIKGTIRLQRPPLCEKDYGRSTLTSKQIFQNFRAMMGGAARRNHHLRRRYIDFRAFDKCGPFVDWRMALEL